MFELATCPACGKFALAPAEWSADSVVRCPHCLAEYRLARAASQPLPRLIASAIVEAPTTNQDAATVPAETTTAPPPSDQPPSSATVEQTPAETRVGPADSDAQTGRDKPGTDTFSGVFPSVHARDHADAYDFIPDERRRQLDTAAAVAARLRGSTRPRSLLAEIIKVALGGVVGLAIGYWALNYFGGRRFDWLTVYLPGCPHTRDHWPIPYLKWESTDEATPTAPAERPEWPEPPEPAESTEPMLPPESTEPQDPAEPSEPLAPPESTDDAPTTTGCHTTPSWLHC